jgi:hypothetical protein
MWTNKGKFDEGIQMQSMWRKVRVSSPQRTTPDDVRDLQDQGSTAEGHRGEDYSGGTGGPVGVDAPVEEPARRTTHEGMGMIELKFELENKETTNNVRFKELPTYGEAPRIGTIYLRKWVWESLDKPTHLKVTLEAE